MSHNKRWGLICIISVWMALPLPAQIGQTSIVGVVKDATGAVLPGVSVTVVNEKTQVAKTVLTNDSGMYELPFLAAGTYMVRAELPGFKVVSRRGIETQIREIARVDFDLEPAEIREEVVVEASQPLLITDNAEVSKVVSHEEVTEMPLFTRDFADLQILTPGAVPALFVGNFAGLKLSEGFNIAGSTQYSGAYSVDGADNNRNYYFGNATSPSLEMIQGVKIQTAGASSEYGGGSYHVDVSLKSGTNDFHGSLFEYLQHDALSARNAFSGNEPPHLRRSQFGGSIGGPIIRNKLFFFGVFEGIRQRQGRVATNQVATLEERQGIFSFSIRDPLTKKPFAHNRIPTNRISPVARFFFDKVWPQPNHEDAFYRADAINFLDRNQFEIKLDYAHDPSNTFYWRVARESRIFDTFSSWLLAPRLNHFDNVLGTFHYNRTISPTVINTFMISARRDFNTGESDSDQNQGVQFLKSVGMDLGGPAGVGYPHVFITGKGFSGRTGQWFTPSEHSGNIFQVRDTLRWTKGRHGLSMGFELKYYQNNEMDEGSSRGSHTYNGRYSGSGLADFMLGIPSRLVFQPIGGMLYLRNSISSAYIQDDWKLHDRFTLNLGLRYEYISYPTELYNRMSTVHPHLGPFIIVSSDSDQLPDRADPLAVAAFKPGTFITSKQAGLPPSLRFPDRNNFAPRVGLAFRAAGDLTIRAGYGINYIKNTQAVVNDRNNSFGLPFRFNRLIINPDPVGFNLLNPFTDFRTSVANIIESSRYVDPHFKMAYTQTWSLNIQKRLPARSVLDVGYVGNRLVDGKTSWPWNMSPSWPNRNDRFPGFRSITAFTNGGESRYDSLQVQVRKQTTNGLFAHLNYTWSKTMGNIVGESGASNIYLFDQELMWSRGRWSRAHVLTANFIYKLPFGKGARWMNSPHPILEGILGGWQLTGIVKGWSGTPMNIVSSVAKSRLTAPGSVPADRLAHGELTDPTRDQWFDTNAFARPPAGRPGNAGFSIVEGPGAVTEDLGLYKNFFLSEGVRLQVRFESYNAFNHVNLGSPGNDVDNARTFGIIRGSGDARDFQLALRLDF